MLTNAIEAAFQSHNAQIVRSKAIGLTSVPTYFVVWYDAIGWRQPCPLFPWCVITVAWQHNPAYNVLVAYVVKELLALNKWRFLEVMNY